MNWYRVYYDLYLAGGRKMRTWTKIRADTPDQAIAMARSNASSATSFQHANAVLIPLPPQEDP